MSASLRDKKRCGCDGDAMLHVDVSVLFFDGCMQRSICIPCMNV